MKEIISFLNEGRETRFGKIAKKCVTKDLGQKWDDDNYFSSADEWLEDYNIFTDDDVAAIWHVISAISDGDDAKKYKELADKYFD